MSDLLPVIGTPLMRACAEHSLPYPVKIDNQENLSREPTTTACKRCYDNGTINIIKPMFQLIEKGLKSMNISYENNTSDIGFPYFNRIKSYINNVPIEYIYVSKNEALKVVGNADTFTFTIVLSDNTRIDRTVECSTLLTCDVCKVPFSILPEENFCLSRTLEDLRALARRLA